MRTAIIVGRKHGRKDLELVSGPEVPILEQKDLFKDFQRVHAHDDWEHVELWISDAGRVKERKLDHPKKAKELADARAKAEAELKSRIEKAKNEQREAVDKQAAAEAESLAKKHAKANEHKASVVESLLKPDAVAARAKAAAEAKEKDEAEAKANADADARAKAEADKTKPKGKNEK